MAEEVKLFGTWASPYSRRVELALKLKGIQYEYIEEDLSNKSPSLLKYNPVHKKIPVLVHNEKPIVESLVIIEYIDETWKNNAILPEDPCGRALARFWAKFVDEKISQTARKLNVVKEEEKEHVLEEVHQQLKLLENELKGKDFFGGATIGYLDIVAFCLVYWFQVRQEAMEVELVSEEKFPVLCKWVGKLLDVDVIKECVPPRDKHLAKVRARAGAAKSASK